MVQGWEHGLRLCAGNSYMPIPKREALTRRPAAERRDGATEASNIRGPEVSSIEPAVHAIGLVGKRIQWGSKGVQRVAATSIGNFTRCIELVKGKQQRHRGLGEVEPAMRCGPVEIARAVARYDVVMERVERQTHMDHKAGPIKELCGCLGSRCCAC